VAFGNTNKELNIFINANTTNFMAGMKQVSKGMAVAGAAITGALAYAVKGSIDFETKLKRIEIQSGATAKQMTEIKKVALSKDMVELGKSGSEVADVFNRLASEGYDVVEMRKMLNPIIETAIVLGTEEGETTKLMLNLMQQYNLEADDMAHINDVLAGTLANTSFQGNELVETMKYAGVAAGELGWSLEGTIPIVDAVIKVTGEASMAGTQFRQMIVKLRDPTSEMTEELDKVGISLDDVAEAIKTPTGLVKLLGEAHERGANFVKMFGARASTAAVVIARESVPAIEELTKKVSETGFAHEAVTGIMDTTAGKIKAAKAEFQNLRTEIGDFLLPILKDSLLPTIQNILVNIRTWVEENRPLAESIVKWTAGLGIALTVLGSIGIILPGIITGFTLLAPAMLPFAVGGAIVLGFKKLSDYLRDIRKEALELDKISLSEIDKSIENLATEANNLQLAMSEINWGTEDAIIATIKHKEYAAQLVKINEQLCWLYERREELTKAEKEGIDVTEEKLKLDKEVAKILADLGEKQEELRKQIEKENEERETANALTEITNEIYKLTHTAVEVAIRDLDLQKQAYLDTGIEMEVVNKWYELQTESLEELNKKQEENIGIMEEVARVTKVVTDKIYELTHTPYEVKLKNIKEEYDGYIKIVEEAKLSIEKKKIKIDNINIARGLEIKSLDKLIKKEEEGVDQKNKLADAYETITDKIYELTHTPMETIIKRLEEERQGYIDLGISIELADELFSLQILKLEEVGDAFITLDNTVKPVITTITGYLETQLAGAISGLLSQTKDFEWSWSKFWEGLKNTLINAVAAMIAKLVVLAAFKWLFPFLGFDTGGGVGYNLGGEVKGFASGGGVDTIPAMLTEGEYVIAKPMTDFIRKFKAIPQNLTAAIAGGFPTPTPAFAGGGLVGNTNVSNVGNSGAGFGETKIYVNITGNNISNKLDIKNIAEKVSNEIARKIKLLRRV